MKLIVHIYFHVMNSREALEHFMLLSFPVYPGLPHTKTKKKIKNL